MGVSAIISTVLELRRQRHRGIEDDLKTDSFCNHNANLGFNQLVWFSGCQVGSEDHETKKIPMEWHIPKGQRMLGNQRSRAKYKSSELRVS